VGLRTHWPVVAILVGFLAIGLMYSLTTPLFEAPDELQHFEYVRHLVRTGSLPNMRVGVRPWEQEGAQPPLYYLTAAAILHGLPSAELDASVRLNPHARIGLPASRANKNRVVHTADERFPFRGLARTVHAARLASLAWGSLGVIGTYMLGWLALGRRTTQAALAAALVAALPQFAFIAGAVSNDSSITAVAAWALAGLWYVSSRVPSPRSGAWVGLLTGLAALCKLSGTLIVGFGLILLAVRWRRWASQHYYGSALAAYVAMAALVGGWWYVRNWLWYGDPTGLRPMLDVVGRYRTPLTLSEIAAQWQGIWRSFWGVFGWFNIELPGWIYVALGGATLVTVMGGMLRLLVPSLPRGLSSTSAFQTEPKIEAPPPSLGWLILWTGIVLVALVNWMRITPGAQGRLIFPALPALAVLAAWCWQGWHARWGTLAGWGMVAGLVILSIVVPFAVIRPAYQPPPLLNALPSGATQLNFIFGGRIHLLGYQLSHQTLRPGDALAVTLFWQGRESVAQDPSVFVHLVSNDGLLISQNDSFPAGGSWAISQWPTGAVISDTHWLPIPATTYTPDEAMLHVGLYDPNTGERWPTSPPTDENSAPIATVKIEPRPGEVPNATCVNFGDQLTLIGYELKRRTIPAGKSVRLTLYWRLNRPLERKLTTFAQVLGEGDRIWGQRDTEPAPKEGDWQVGQIVRDDKKFPLDKATPPGFYRLYIGVYDSDTHELLETVPSPGCLTADPLVLTQIRVLPRP
jgi:4-amino-4-deoxy-L-arabinose transferase-like glycosyltransferase